MSNLFESSKDFNIIKLPIVDGECILFESFFSFNESRDYYQHFLKDIAWEQEEMNMFGKLVKFPRLTAWYGDEGMSYSFSGLNLNPKPWTSKLKKIKEKIELESQVQFNSVLLNRYRTGKDKISWHTDAEKSLGPCPEIASVNFGATRVFQIRHNETGETHDIKLKNGSLLIMRKELQHCWKHQIKQDLKLNDERINLTFRKIII